MPVFDPVVFVRAENIQIAQTARVDSFVKIEGGNGVVIGEYVHIASFAHINLGGGYVEIGDYACIASGAKVIGGSSSPDGMSMSAAAPQAMQVVKRMRTVIGEFTCVLTNAVIFPGVTVGKGAVIGAGAVVTKDVPPFEIWAGVPARKIGLRKGWEEWQKSHGSSAS